MNTGSRLPFNKKSSFRLNTLGSMDRSLKWYVVQSGMSLATAAIFSSLAVSLILLVVSHRNTVSRIEDDLARIGPQVARRVAGELLIGESGLPQPVIQHLKEIFQIPFIQLLPPQKNCLPSPRKPLGACEELVKGKVWRVDSVPSIAEARFIVLGVDAPGWFGGMQWGLYFFAATSILLLSAVGIMRQWKFLRVKVLDPISQLLSAGGKSENALDWPKELKEVSKQLESLLSERDRAVRDLHHLKTQALLGEFANGVIHDCQRPLTNAGILIDSSSEIPASVRRQLKDLIDTPRLIIREHLRNFQNLSTYKHHLDDVAVEATTTVFATPGAVAKKIVTECAPGFLEKGVELIVDISKKSFFTFAPLSFTDLLRAISNIVENALDESQKGTKVVFTVSMGADRFEISIRDFGRGFDPSVLTKVKMGERATTKGSKGNGLGILTTKAVINRGGGDILIVPMPNGTLVRVTLPIVADPTWFSNILQRKERSIIALDDDFEMKCALEGAFPGRQISLYQDQTEFLAAAEDPASLLLVDFEFGGEVSGLDLIAQNGLQNRAVLFSERPFFDEQLTKRAIEVGCGVFPKGCLGESPHQFSSPLKVAPECHR